MSSRPSKRNSKDCPGHGGTLREHRLRNPAKRVLLKIVIEGWKVSRVYQRLISKLDATEQTRFISQLRYCLKQLEENLSEVGYTLVNLEGHPFDPERAAIPIHLNDFSPSDLLIVAAQLDLKPGLAYAGKIDRYVADLVIACDGKRPGELLNNLADSVGADRRKITAPFCDVVRRLIERGFLLPEVGQRTTGIERG
jgi:hypothetical protein